MNMSTDKEKKKTYETINVSADTEGVSCDGGHPALGHPKVWYNFGLGNFAACHYCSRIFIRDAK